jgi:hypothetical protein
MNLSDVKSSPLLLTSRKTFDTGWGGLTHMRLVDVKKVACTISFPKTHDKEILFTKFVPITKTGVLPMSRPLRGTTPVTARFSWNSKNKPSEKNWPLLAEIVNGTTPDMCPGVIQCIFSKLLYLPATGPIVPNLHERASSWIKPYPDARTSEPPSAGPVAGTIASAAVLFPRGIEMESDKVLC